jgi:hypothetical protein
METDGFKIPSSLLKQFDECSFGGFVLFSFDSNGNPQVHSKYDNSLNAMAIQNFISNWSSAMHDISVESTTQILKNEREEEPLQGGDDDTMWDESPFDEDEEEL